MSIIKGSNVVLYFKDDNIWKPLACAKTVTLTTNAETGETSTKGTGKWRTHRYVKLNWTVSCSGICSLDMNMTIPKLRQYQFDFQPILINFQAIDSNGLTESYSGYILVTTVDGSSTFNATYDYSMDGLGTGELIMTDQPIDPNACCSTQWLYYDGVGGEYITGPILKLVHRTIDGHIFRDGVEFRPSGIDQDGTATPVGKQFAFDPETGEISFDTNGPSLEPDEPVDIPYLTCGDTGGGDGEDCEIAEINDRNLSDAEINVEYNQLITISGTQPFEISNITKPDWMTVMLNEDQVILSGTPTEAATNQDIRFTITNCGGEDIYFDSINVSDCIPVTIIGTPDLPDVQEDTDYNYSFSISGSLPYILGITTKPAWMNIEIFGTLVIFSGHAGVHHANNEVKIIIINCSDAAVTFEDTFDITF